MLLTPAGTCFLCARYCDVAVKWRIPAPDSSSSFKVAAILGMVILMTFMSALKTVTLLSRNFISIYGDTHGADPPCGGYASC